MTPFLQNWFCANFQMIGWFAKKGVSLSSKHRDASLNGLHLYAVRIGYPGANFSHDPEAVPAEENYIAQIQKEVDIPHDECTCPCSPNGCSPIKFLCQRSSHSGSRRVLFRTWLKKVKPERRLLQQYVLEFTRCFLFDFLGCKHTYCILTQEGGIVSEKYRKYYTSISEHAMMERVLLFQNDKLPRPRKSVTSLENAEMEKVLDLYISKYDEMPRLETMLAEAQPFNYVHWIVERYEGKTQAQKGLNSLQ